MNMPLPFHPCQQPSIHEYIKEISDTQVNQAVSEKDMESIYEQYGKYLIEIAEGL